MLKVSPDELKAFLGCPFGAGNSEGFSELTFLFFSHKVRPKHEKNTNVFFKRHLKLV